MMSGAKFVANYGADHESIYKVYLTLKEVCGHYFCEKSTLLDHVN